MIQIDAGMFVVLLVLGFMAFATVFVVAASMLSSSISRWEERGGRDK